jgi:uncharacterized protein YjbI with pentapeptide repeats
MKIFFGNWSYDPKRSKRENRGKLKDSHQTPLAFAMLIVVIAQVILLYQQNKRIDEQIYISQAAPAWQALPQTEGLAVQLRNDADKACLDRNMLQKSAKTVGDLTLATCWGDLARVHASTSERYRWLEVWNRQGGRTTEADFAKREVIASRYEDSPESQFNMQGFELAGDAYLQPSTEATATAEVITEAMLPYRSLETKNKTGTDTPELSNRPISRERALVLKQFLNNGYSPVGEFDSSLLDNFEFVNVQLAGIGLKNASLRCASFRGSDLRFAIFEGADLSGAKFSSSDLRDSHWDGAILDGASFDHVLMPPAETFRPASLKNVHFEGAIVDTPDWLNELEMRRPRIVGFDTSEWFVTPDIAHHGFAIGRRGEVLNPSPMPSCNS